MIAAIEKAWNGKQVLGVAGPSLMWRTMVDISAKAMGLHRRIVAVPMTPIIAMLSALEAVGIRPIDPNIFRRFSEDVEISTAPMGAMFSVEPRPFEIGVKAAIAGWQSAGML
jgi:hypothetical protein